MNVITIRIDKKVKEELKKFPHVNWSQVAREAILKRLELEKRKAAAKKVDEVKKGVEAVAPGQIVRWIREDRER